MMQPATEDSAFWEWPFGDGRWVTFSPLRIHSQRRAMSQSVVGMELYGHAIVLGLVAVLGHVSDKQSRGRTLGGRGRGQV